MPDLLRQAGIVLGDDYPLPLVDLNLSRRQALQDWDGIKSRRVRDRTE